MSDQGKEDNNYWLKSGKVALIERVSVLVFGVSGFILLVRMLPKESYGVWMLYLTMVGLLDTSRNGFFKNPLMRFLNQEEVDQESVKISSLTLNLLTTVIVSLVFFGASFFLSIEWENEEIITLFTIHIATNIFHTFFFNAEYISKANMRYVGPALAYFLKGFIFVGGILIYYFAEWELSLTALGTMYSIAASVAATTLVISIRDQHPGRFKIDKEWISRLFGYGKYTLGTNIGAVFQRNIDMWMLSFFMSTGAVAIYNAAIRVANLFELPLMAIASILFPKAVQRAEKEGESAFRPMYEKSVAIILILVTPLVIGVIIFSEEVILLLAGEDYLESAEVLRVTMLYGLILPFHKQMGLLFDAIGKAKVNTIFTLRNAAINAILNAIAIPQFGIMGAAYATFATFTSMLLYNLWYLHRHYEVSLFTIIKHMFFYGGKFARGDIKGLN